MQRSRILKNIVSVLAKVLPGGSSAYIFGSQARGDYSDKSDWDFLILLKGNDSLNLSDRGNYSLPIYMLGAELGVDINPVFYTDKEWERRSMTPFYKNVIRDRIKIWG